MPELSFLADMNISPATVSGLKTEGWNIIRVSDVMDQGSPDIDIILYAQEHNHILITQDLDFSRLLAVRGYNTPSVLNLRLDKPKPEWVTNRMKAVIKELREKITRGIVISADDDSIRYRNLPIDTENQ